MDPKQLEQTVIQVLQMNTLNTLHIGTRSHASDAENKDTYAHHALPQMCTAPTAGHQITAPSNVEGTIATTTAHQTATATKVTTPHPLPHRQIQTDCSHQQKPAQLYNHLSQTQLVTQIQQTSRQQ